MKSVLLNQKRRGQYYRQNASHTKQVGITIHHFLWSKHINNTNLLYQFRTKFDKRAKVFAILCHGRHRIYITFQPCYPAATLINLIVSPTLALTIFLPLLGPFSLIYFLTSTKGIKYFYSLITGILLFLRWFLFAIIYNAMQYFLRYPRMRTIAINANARFELYIYRYTSYFIVHSYHLSRWRLSNYYRIVDLIDDDSALRWLNILGSISNRTSFIVILQVVTNRCQDLYYYTVMDFIHVYCIYYVDFLL